MFSAFVRSAIGMLVPPLFIPKEVCHTSEILVAPLGLLGNSVVFSKVISTIL